MTISEYLQIHDAALLDAAAIIGLRGRAAASPENHFVLLNASTGGRATDGSSGFDSCFAFSQNRQRVEPKQLSRG